MPLGIKGFMFVLVERKLDVSFLPTAVAKNEFMDVDFTWSS